MAKQTFTTGQVLTASQMTSLQQTALGGGAASTKTANYVLVAADAGTTVAMNAAGATTITVNTGLFAAGDTVFIQNIGAGVCTITAGTATVNTAGALALPQYDAGILYFTSASAAIFYDYIQVGAASPLTTKGDLYTFSTSDTRLGVGANGTVLTAASGEATGLQWAAPSAAGANWSLLNSGGTSLTGATTTVSGISGKNQILVLITQVSSASSGATVRVRLNGDTASNYYNIGKSLYFNSTYSASMSEQRTANISYVEFGSMANNAASNISGYIWFDGCNSSGVKTYHKQMGIDTGGGNALRYTDGGGYWNNSATVTEVNISMDNGDLDSGTVYIYTSAV